jgi:hypothetical protein
VAIFPNSDSARSGALAEWSKALDLNSKLQ